MLLIGCSPGCPVAEVITYNLPPNSMALVPYALGQTMTFEGPNGALRPLEVVGIERDSLSLDACEDCCVWEQGVVQSWRIRPEVGYPRLFISLSNYGPDLLDRRVAWSIQVDDLAFAMVWVDSIDCALPPLTCRDSVVVAGNTYRDVWELEMTEDATFDTAQANQIWYAPEVGVLRVDYSDGSNWQLR